MKDFDLKPCPFCGRTKTLILVKSNKFNETNYKFVCSFRKGGCGASSGFSQTGLGAEKTWNTRS